MLFNLFAITVTYTPNKNDYVTLRKYKTKIRKGQLQEQIYKCAQVMLVFRTICKNIVYKHYKETM